MDIKLLVKNWRICYGILPWLTNSFEIEHPLWYTEIFSNKEYIVPDCAVLCVHCGQCLGCIRKEIIDYENYGLRINTDCMICAKSPTGLHEASS